MSTPRKSLSIDNFLDRLDKQKQAYQQDSSDFKAKDSSAVSQATRKIDVAAKKLAASQTSAEAKQNRQELLMILQDLRKEYPKETTFIEHEDYVKSYSADDWWKSIQAREKPVSEVKTDPKLVVYVKQLKREIDALERATIPGEKHSSEVVTRTGLLRELINKSASIESFHTHLKSVRKVIQGGGVLTHTGLMPGSKSDWSLLKKMQQKVESEFATELGIKQTSLLSSLSSLLSFTPQVTEKPEIYHFGIKDGVEFYKGALSQTPYSEFARYVKNDYVFINDTPLQALIRESKLEDVHYVTEHDTVDDFFKKYLLSKMGLDDEAAASAYKQFSRYLNDAAFINGFSQDINARLRVDVLRTNDSITYCLPAFSKLKVHLEATEKGFKVRQEAECGIAQKIKTSKNNKMGDLCGEEKINIKLTHSFEVDLTKKEMKVDVTQSTMEIGAGANQAVVNQLKETLTRSFKTDGIEIQAASTEQSSAQVLSSKRGIS